MLCFCTHAGLTFTVIYFPNKNNIINIINTRRLRHRIHRTYVRGTCAASIILCAGITNIYTPVPALFILVLE